MEFRFSIVDENKAFNIIEEPVGWDNISFKLTRDKDRHGIFYDYTGNSFEFYALGRDLIKTAYEAKGLEALLWLRVEYDCTELGQWQHFYTSRFLFAQYKEVCGDKCYISIGLENISEIVELLNRLEQKVDITAAKCFDTITDLAAYDRAPFTATLPGKTIKLRLNANNGELPLVSPDFTEDPYWCSSDVEGHCIQYVIPGFNNILETEINDNTLSNTDLLTNVLDATPDSGLTPLIDFSFVNTVTGKNQSIKCITGGNINFNFRLKGTLTITGSGSVDIGYQLSKMLLGDSDYSNLVIDNPFGTATDGSPYSFDITGNYDTPLLDGDKYWLLFTLTTTGEITSCILTLDKETFFTASITTLCDPTTGQAFMINEAMSRIIESITNNKLTLYSEYLGRTDSQPYAFESNGCGGLAFITNGLKIRQAKNADGTEPALTISLKDCFDSVSAIHNLGMGVEKFLSETNIKEDLTDDLLNSLSRDFRVRVEDWKFFYKSDIVLTHDNVAEISRTVKQDKHLAIFRIGYEKWETENFSGLDEFLTKREYRTQLTQVSNSLDKISKMIASGYAYEITRRIGATSQDWRYDNDIFIICVDDSYTVEQGNITDPENIIDPATVLNYRISPARNLMRWMPMVIASYKNVTTASQLLFSAGDGNLIAKGELTGETCRKENAAIQENQTMDSSFFADVTDALPIYHLEEVSYEYPCSIDEFKMLLANPYARIRFSNECTSGTGWILDVDYRPNDGKAKFTLLPCIDEIVDNVAAGNHFIVTEDGITITTEDGTEIIIEP